MHLIYITFPKKEEAIKIAQTLLQEKLIACGNIYEGITSIYEYEGKIEQNEEVTLICKTSDSSLDKAMERVKALHSYDCPCIISIKIEKGNKDFVKWVETCCNLDY
jgi:periplasmic divalent cation tolerance protein